MGHAINEDLKPRIALMYVIDGLTMEVIAERLRVSISLVSKVVHLYRFNVEEKDVEGEAHYTQTQCKLTLKSPKIT